MCCVSHLLMLLTQTHDEPVLHICGWIWKDIGSQRNHTAAEEPASKKANDVLLNFYYIIIFFFLCFVWVLYYIYFFLFFLRGSGEEFLPPSPEKKKVKRWVLIKGQQKTRRRRRCRFTTYSLIYLLPSIRLCVSVHHHLHLSFEFIKDVGKDPGKQNKENIV